MKCNFLWFLLIALLFAMGGCDDDEERLPAPMGSFSGVLIRDSVVVDSFNISLKDNTADKALVTSVFSTVGDVLSLKCVYQEGWQLTGQFQLPGSLGQGNFQLYKEPFVAFIDSAGLNTYTATWGQLTISDHQRLDVEGWPSKGDYIKGNYLMTMTDTNTAAVLRAEVSFLNIMVRPE